MTSIVLLKGASKMISWPLKHRRQLTCMLMLMGFLTARSTIDPSHSAEISIPIEWQMSQHQTLELKRKLAFQGETRAIEQDLDGTKGVPLVVLLVGLVAAPRLVDALITAAHDVTCGGVVVLEKQEGLKIDCSKELGHGVIAVKDRRGTEIYRRAKSFDEKSLIELIVSMMKK